MHCITAVSSPARGDIAAARQGQMSPLFSAHRFTSPSPASHPSPSPSAVVRRATPSQGWHPFPSPSAAVRRRASHAGPRRARAGICSRLHRLLSARSAGPGQAVASNRGQHACAGPCRLPFSCPASVIVSKQRPRASLPSSASFRLKKLNQRHDNSRGRLVPRGYPLPYEHDRDSRPAPDSAARCPIVDEDVAWSDPSIDGDILW